MTRRKTTKKPSGGLLAALRDELDPGGFEIAINADESIRYVSHFKPGRSSLASIGAQGLVEELNQLGMAELVAVANAVKIMPFPLGEEDKVFDLVLEEVTKPDCASKWPAADRLGALRRDLCLQHAGGFNAPGDTYIRAAVRHVKEHGLFQAALVEDPRQEKLFD